MAKLALKKNSTDVTVYLFVQDSSKTAGEGLTGLAYNTASLVASYVRPLAARQAISLASQTVTGAHSDGGFVEVDSTNMPGLYRLDLPDAVCATGVPSAVVMLKGAANMAPVLLEIQLTDFDLNSTSNPVGAAASVTAGVTVSTIANNAITANAIADNAIDAGAIASNAITAAKIDTDAISAAKLAADAVSKIQNGLATPTNITGGTITTVTNLTNLPSIPANWLTADGIKADAVTKIQSGLATPTNITGGTITTVTNLTNLPSIPADWITANGIKSDAVTKIQNGLATPTNITQASGITLADNAITAAKFDESTAFPLKSADAGATAVARVGADGDTLETLSDQMDGVQADTGDILADTRADGVVVGSIKADAITASSLKLDAVDEIADGVWDEAIAGHVAAGTFGAKNQKVVPSEILSDYKADVSSLATSLALTGVENKIDTVDGIVDDIKAKTDNLPADPASQSAVESAIDGIPEGITTDDILNSIIEGAVTLRDSLKLANAMNAGKVSGGKTTSIVFRDLADTLDRIIMTVDESGNRSAVVKDLG